MLTSSSLGPLSHWPVFIARQEKGAGHSQRLGRYSTWIHRVRKAEPVIPKVTSTWKWGDKEGVQLSVFTVTWPEPTLSFGDSVLFLCSFLAMFWTWKRGVPCGSSADISREHFSSCTFGQSTVVASKLRAGFVGKPVLGGVRTGVCFFVLIRIGDFSDLESLSLIRFDEFITLICPCILLNPHSLSPWYLLKVITCFLFQICLYLWELMICYAFGEEGKTTSWFLS